MYDYRGRSTRGSMECGLEVRGQLCGTGFLLLPFHGFWGSCHQACMASSLIARPSHQAYCFIYNINNMYDIYVYIIYIILYTRMGFVWHFHACKMVRLVQMWLK